jgi:hypothetical protein
VRPVVVVLLLPGCRQHPRLQRAVELLPLQQFVPQPRGERLRVAVLPGRTWLDRRYTRLRLTRQPSRRSQAQRRR